MMVVDSIQSDAVITRSIITYSTQCLRNYIGTSAFADVSYLMADVEAKFYV